MHPPLDIKNAIPIEKDSRRKGIVLLYGHRASTIEMPAAIFVMTEYRGGIEKNRENSA